jgi:hypothetical protein
MAAMSIGASTTTTSHHNTIARGMKTSATAAIHLFICYNECDPYRFSCAYFSSDRGVAIDQHV